MKDKFQNLLVKLKLDKHHRIERFGVLFFSLVFIMCVLTGISLKAHIENQHLVLTDQAVYTETAEWSLTGQEVSVVDIYRNEDCTRAFVLLHMDMSNMSLDARDYQILMTGYQGETLKNKKAIGAVYVFGNTGYMGLYFADASGFEKQMYDIVVRNLELISSNKREENEVPYDDVSFKHNNQIRIYANLAGRNATVAKFLESESPELIDVYAETVAIKQEDEIRNSLNSSLITMNNQMSMINEQAEFLNKMHVVIPELPASIASDYITDDATLTSSNPTRFDASMYDEASRKISSVYENVKLDTSDDENGNNGYVNSDKLYLVTNFVFQGGLQYNYQDMKLTDHYVTNNILPQGMKFKKFETELSNESVAYAAYLEDIEARYSKWYIKDENGDVEQWAYTPGYADDEAIFKATEAYKQAVIQLYETKKTYQTQYLRDLAKIEASAETAADMFSISADDKVLIIYE